MLTKLLKMSLCQYYQKIATSLFRDVVNLSKMEFKSVKFFLPSLRFELARLSLKGFLKFVLDILKCCIKFKFEKLVDLEFL